MAFKHGSFLGESCFTHPWLPGDRMQCWEVWGWRLERSLHNGEHGDCWGQEAHASERAALSQHRSGDSSGTCSPTVCETGDSRTSRHWLRRRNLTHAARRDAKLASRCLLAMGGVDGGQYSTVLCWFCCASDLSGLMTWVHLRSARPFAQKSALGAFRLSRFSAADRACVRRERY